MTDEDLHLALSIFADATRDRVLEMPEAIEDDAMWERNRDRFDPKARISFITPGEGVQVMEQEYEGIEGLRTGWRNWLAPWESYRITIDEIIDAGENGVLLLVTSMAKMQDTGTEVPQSAATLFRVSKGQISEVRFYLDQQQAKRDAGLGR